MSLAEQSADQDPSTTSLPSFPTRSISRPLYEFALRPRMGTVFATFERSCYLDFEHRLSALVAPELGTGPLTIVLEVPQGFSFRNLSIGQRAWLSRDVLLIEAALSALMGNAVVWDPVIIPWTSQPHALLDGLRRTRAVLDDEAPALSFAHLLPHALPGSGTSMDDVLSTQARAGIRGLANGLRTIDLAALAGGAYRLAGLGHGLTPAGDDVLVGVLIGLAVAPSPSAESCRHTILRVAAGRSPRISAAYLDAAGKGEASDRWHRLLAVLPEGESLALLAAVRDVMATGETSGSDMLAGFLLSLGVDA